MEYEQQQQQQQQQQTSNNTEANKEHEKLPIKKKFLDSRLSKPETPEHHDEITSPKIETVNREIVIKTEETNGKPRKSRWDIVGTATDNNTQITPSKPNVEDDSMDTEDDQDKYITHSDQSTGYPFRMNSGLQQSSPYTQPSFQTTSNNAPFFQNSSISRSTTRTQ